MFNIPFLYFLLIYSRYILNVTSVYKIFKYAYWQATIPHL